jgi:SAM-dependent methyltransferase
VTPDPIDRSSVDRLAAAALAAGDPTGWFEQLYAEAVGGTASIPWGTDVPGATLVDWFTGRAPGHGSALVVGCGYGRDAEFVQAQGYDTTAFDISATAIAGARTRHAGSTVRYEVADLLALPPQWVGAFDLVVESHNVQALPVELHAAAAAAVSSLVAPGGTLLVLGAVPADEATPGPPWPLTRAEVEAFAGTRLVLDSLETVQLPGMDPARWRAVFRRPARRGPV